MKSILESLSRLFSLGKPTYDEDYLAAAVDLYDLEIRLRELDRRRTGSSFWQIALWVFTSLLFLVALLGFDLWVFSAPSLLLAIAATIAAAFNHGDSPVRNRR